MDKTKRLSRHLCLYFILFNIFLIILPTGAKNLPFVLPDIKEPKFSNRIFLVTSYGAVGDGHTLNTDAFAKTIEACSKAGGGRVDVQAGLWLTGPIQLKSNVNLHLEEGAIILFSPDYKAYPLIERSSGGKPEVRCMPPIYGEGLKNIAITGSGIIDGSGQAWRPVKKSKLTAGQWEKLIASGGVVDEKDQVWYPSTEAMNGKKTVEMLEAKNADIKEYTASREYLRPVMVGLVRCKNVLLDGPTFQNSPDWNIHPLLCENMIIQNINVRNPWYSQNGDGLDPESCKNVIIRNCKFDVGDDAICMKSGKDEYGRKRGVATENVAIENCIVYHGHGGFVIGSEMSGGVRNVYVRNCNFLGTDTGLRFKSARGRGGIVEKIYIQDISMKDIAEDAVIFDLFYFAKKTANEVTAAGEETPVFRDIHFRNIVCNEAERAMIIQGLSEMPVQELCFENITISAKTGVTCYEADGVNFRNVKIISETMPVFDLNNSRNIVFDKIKLPDADEAVIKLAGSKTAAIHLTDIDKSQIEKKIQFEKNVKPDAIITK